MSWLTPLGFLGLISILVLIIIYIIKPNYENKFISSTYVWKLSLKYKKNKIPINKLRNIILFLCQVLVLTMATLIIAQPFLDDGDKAANEKVIIIDASASMMAQTGGITRFEKAIYDVKDEIQEQLNIDDGKVTVILAAKTASYLIRSEGIESKTTINEELDNLLLKDIDEVCTWGKSDIQGAIALAEQITSISESVEVSLYTDTNYVDHGRIKINLVNDVSDVNIAILDVRAVKDDGQYRFEIDIVSYGRSDTVHLKCDISNVYIENDAGDMEYTDLNCDAYVRLESDVITTVAFGYKGEIESDFAPENLGEFSTPVYEDVHVYFDERDSFAEDNSFWLYGGITPVIKVQYYSEKPNNFFATAFMVISEKLGYRWDIKFDQVKLDEPPASEGYDIYIYEHDMPSSLPTDGIVLLVNPDTVPIGAGFKIGGEDGDNIGRCPVCQKTDIGLPLSTDDPNHPLLKGVTPESIHVTYCSYFSLYDGYTPLLTYKGNPVFIAKNEPDEKIAVMSFSLHYSDFALNLEFPLMLYNLIEYYMPSTVTKYVYEIDETVEIGSSSEAMTYTAPGAEAELITEFPAIKTLTVPGSYTVTPESIYANDAGSTSFFVKVPASESDINATEDKLDNPVFFEKSEDNYIDLLIFFASLLVALLFFEWWLQTREQYQIGKQK